MKQKGGMKRPGRNTKSHRGLQKGGYGGNGTTSGGGKMKGKKKSGY